MRTLLLVFCISLFSIVGFAKLDPQQQKRLQEAENIKKNPNLYVGVGYGATEAEADANAIKDLAASISMTVKSHAVTHTTQDNETFSVEDAVSTFVTLSNTKKMEVISTPDNVQILRYVSRRQVEEDMQNRGQTIQTLVSQGSMHEQSLNLADALKYYNWAYNMALSVPAAIMLDVDDSRQDAKTWLNSRINNILNNIKVAFEKIEYRPGTLDPYAIVLNVSYNGQPVANLDFSYFNNDNRVTGRHVRDGRAIADFEKLPEGRINLLIEYKYENEGRQYDPELDAIFSLRDAATFPKATITVPFRTTASDSQLFYEQGSFSECKDTSVPIYLPSQSDPKQSTAIVRLQFININNDDIENKVNVSTSSGFIVKKEYVRMQDGALECWIHIDPSNNASIEVSVDNIGRVRIPGLHIDGGKIYQAKLGSDGMVVSVCIGANMPGTAIFLDGEDLGRIDTRDDYVCKDGVRMGSHVIKTIYNGRERLHNIQVSRSNTRFDLDVINRFNVTFTCNEPGATLYENNRFLASLPAKVEVLEGPHTFEVHCPGFENFTFSPDITDARPINFDIFKTKKIKFVSRRDDYDLTGAYIYVNDRMCGNTPKTLSLPYGRYNVRMSYDGKDKTGNLTVDGKTSSVFSLKFPGTKTHNPFKINYRKRSSGISVGYVQKWMAMARDGKTSLQNYYGEERHMGGIQVGVPIQPIFGYGLGLNTGVYYEIYKFTDTNLYVDNVTGEPFYDSGHYMEHDVHVPLGLIFRLPLSRQCSLFVHGGAALDWSVATTYYEPGGYTENLDYRTDYFVPERFNFSYEFGGGFQVMALQISAKYQMGINNNKTLASTFGVESARLRKLAIQLALIF